MLYFISYYHTLQMKYVDGSIQSLIAKVMFWRLEA